MNPPFQQVPSIKWIPPPCNIVKLNFDGFVCHNKKAAARFVVRDHEGNPILAGSCCVGNSSVPIAECSALRDGLFHALCNDIRRVQVEGDSKLIIDLINNRSPPLLGDSVLFLVMFVGWLPSLKRSPSSMSLGKQILWPMQWLA